MELETVADQVETVEVVESVIQNETVNNKDDMSTSSDDESEDEETFLFEQSESENFLFIAKFAAEE